MHAAPVAGLHNEGAQLERAAVAERNQLTAAHNCVCRRLNRNRELLPIQVVRVHPTQRTKTIRSSPSRLRFCPCQCFPPRALPSCMSNDRDRIRMKGAAMVSGQIHKTGATMLQCSVMEREPEHRYLSRCTDCRMAAPSSWRARRMVTPASQRILCRMMPPLGLGRCQGVGAKQLLERKMAMDDMGVPTRPGQDSRPSHVSHAQRGHQSGSHQLKSRGNQSPGEPAEAAFSNSSAVGLCR